MNNNRHTIIKQWSFNCMLTYNNCIKMYDNYMAMKQFNNKTMNLCSWQGAVNKLETMNFFKQ